MTIDWKYYVVEHAFVVRADLKEMVAERLMRNGQWVEFTDTMDITYNGRQLANEEEAMAKARKLFDKYPELP
jgi:hypothetical protein